MKVTYSTVIDAPLEKCWPILRIFADNWDPESPLKFVLSEGKCQDQVGCVRTITIPGAGDVVERLLCLDDTNHRVSYTILSSFWAIKNYVAEYAAYEVVEGNKTFVQWSGTFEPTVAPGDEKWLEWNALFSGIYKNNLEACARRAGAVKK